MYPSSSLLSKHSQEEKTSSVTLPGDLQLGWKTTNNSYRKKKISALGRLLQKIQPSNIYFIILRTCIMQDEDQKQRQKFEWTLPN